MIPKAATQIALRRIHFALVVWIDASTYLYRSLPLLPANQLPVKDSRAKVTNGVCALAITLRLQL